MPKNLTAIANAVSVTSERETAATLLAGIAIGGSTVGYATFVLPNPPGTDFVSLAIAFAAVILAGLALFRYRRVAPWWAISLVLVLGTAVIAVTMEAVPGKSAVYAPYFVLISIFAFYFLNPRAAFGHLALIGVAYGAVMASEFPPAVAEQWTNGVAVPLLVGLFIWALRLRIEGLVAEQREDAETDVLTALSNRRAFDRTIDEEIKAARLQGAPLSMVVIDLDGFKQLNDTIGHLAGDAALTQIGEVLTKAVRGEDTVFRIGGDEFAVLLPGTPGSEAEMMAGRIATSIAAAFAGEESELTASCGVGVLGPGDSAHDLIAEADEDLYASKFDRSATRGHGRSLDRRVSVHR